MWRRNDPRLMEEMVMTKDSGVSVRMKEAVNGELMR